MRKLVASLLEKLDARSKTPRASFTINGFEPDGRIKVQFTWNKAFVEKIQALGFEAETEEDCVQLFFFASAMRPMQLSVGDDPVQSSSHPTLSGQQNVIMQ
jgi:hypothetical protein